MHFARSAIHLPSEHPYRLSEFVCLRVSFPRTPGRIRAVKSEPLAMKNRASRRLHSVTESIGVSPRIVEMCDGSLSCTHPSKRQGREGDHWEFVKTVRVLTHSRAHPRFVLQCVRSPTTDGGASARIRTTAPVADADCAFYQKKSFEGTKVVDGERRKPPRRVEVSSDRSKSRHLSCMLSIRTRGGGSVHRVRVNSKSTQFQR